VVHCIFHFHGSSNVIITTQYSLVAIIIFVAQLRSVMTDNFLISHHHLRVEVVVLLSLLSVDEPQQILSVVMVI